MGILNILFVPISPTVTEGMGEKFWQRNEVVDHTGGNPFSKKSAHKYTLPWSMFGIRKYM